MDWQPIETAPRDGTIFIGLRYVCTRTFPGEARPVKEYMVEDARWQDGRYRFRDILCGTPTHWAPLVPPTEAI